MVSTTAWLLLVVVVLAGAFVVSAHTAWLRTGDRVNTWILRLLADVRTPWLTDVAHGIKAAGSGWGVTVLGLSVVVLTMIFRRWRHLLVFLCSVFFLVVSGQWIYDCLSRPRPYGVLTIGSWGGYSTPSPPVAVFTIFGIGAIYCLAVPGRPRAYAKTAVAVLVAIFGLARLYLAVDHPDDVLLGAALGVAIPVTAFGYFTPNEVFPVVYRRGRTAHVDVGGRRGEAIRQALRDQLGLTVRGGADIASGHATFWLDSDLAATKILTVTLSAVCGPRVADTRSYAFPGGCVTYQFRAGASPSLASLNGAVGFVPRARLVAYVRNTEDLALCGRGATCPG